MSRYKLDAVPFTLKLKQPFGISRGTKSEVQNVFIQLQADGFTGYGEAAPNNRYEEDAQKVLQYLKAVPIESWNEVEDEKALVERLDNYESTRANPVRAGRAAIEMAWLDWYAKKQGQPLWKYWSIDSKSAVQTSYTIGLDEIEVMQQKVRDAADYPILKVKLGTDRDKAIINGIRAVTDKPIRVDANEGWCSLDEAVAMIDYLAARNVELVEQPLPSAMAIEMKELKKISPLPLAADESFLGDEPLEEIALAFDIINIKLMKIGSMIKARQVIKEARKLGMQIMIGCMIESSLANTAGAVLALEADYADLDGHLLISDDPAAGLALDEEKYIKVNEKPGLGVELDSHRLFG